MPVGGYVSAAPSWAWLILTGGALEAAGILLVAWDLRRTGREIRRYQGRGISATVYPATIQATANVMTPRIKGGTEPTVQERVGIIERVVERLKAEWQEYGAAIEKRIAEQSGEVTKHVEQAAIRRDEEIANLLVAVTAQGKWLRIWSIVFLLLGVAAATLGGILSNL